ncbi:MAG: tRNA pseudouridine(13) synthase TruD [Fimbriiglobus sp.]
MKLKQTPADFRVEELTAVTPGPAGEFAFYRLDKTGWTTPDALQVVRRRWHIDFQRMGYGGLKDRHADTTQYLSIFRGPQRDLTEDRLRVAYLGQLPEPYGSRDVTANRFVVTLRGLSKDAERAATALAATVADAGVPNYFDDQRFGSVGPDRRFVAKEMVLGRFEEALKLALASPYEFDRAESKHEKATLLSRWGDWKTCKAELPRGHARSLVDYLVTHPTDFKGAVARLRPELRGLYLSAFQSDLWNRMLARWLTTQFPAESLGTLALKTGDHPVPVAVPAEVRTAWEELALPLVSARLKPDPAAPWLPLVESVLADEGLTLPKLKVPGMDKPFFSKGDRLACLRPAGMTWEPGDDELNRGRRKLRLRFDLPRGAYATMIVKRITAVTGEAKSLERG